VVVAEPGEGRAGAAAEGGEPGDQRERLAAVPDGDEEHRGDEQRRGHPVVDVGGGVDVAGDFQADEERTDGQREPAAGRQHASVSREDRREQLHGLISPHRGANANRFARPAQPVGEVPLILPHPPEQVTPGKAKS
jgi:hypothetical protein